MDATTTWKVEGSYYEVCNCEAICPCRRLGGAKGGRASYDTCDFALSWWIKKGHAGTVDLADMKVVMTGRWIQEGHVPWSVGLYVDERATAEQKDALTEVFLGRAGGNIRTNFAAEIGDVFMVKSAAIHLDHAKNKETIDVAPYLVVRTLEAVQHEKTVSCGIPGHDHPGQEIRAEIFRFKDGPFDWEFRGKCGFATDFAYQSDLTA
jgi:hypothetical protein